jgi:hypothetical protein
MRNNDPSPTITNCAFVGNIGSGISNRNGSVPILTNCILWSNTSGSFDGQTAPIVTFSNVEGGFAGAGNINSNPMFVDPNGADGDPSTWEDNDYHLSPGSPCLNAGNNNALELPGMDLASGPRILNGIVDMGPYEAGACADDAGCDDADLCTSDTCMNGICVNTMTDCIDSDTCTLDGCDPATGLCVNDPIFPCCGDSFCDLGEDECDCPDDCGAPPATESNCIDGVDEDCDGQIDCNDPDCTDDPVCPATMCGNGVCDIGEDCFCCPADCRCTGKNCANSCCGDGVCAKENARNCPVDCGG